MNWNWATSLDQLLRSPTFPMWLTLAAAAFFGIIVLLTLLRAEKSVANGALTVITLLAIAVAVAATIRGFGPGGGAVSQEAGLSAPIAVAMPALSCIDDLAGDAVEEACAKALFGSPDTTAAAVSYAAAQIARLRSFGDVAAANKVMSPELQALRRAIERDRYGLVAYVLMSRDRCSPSDCAAYRSLTDHNQVASNMGERTYEGLISRYASSWNAPALAAAAGPGLSPVAGPVSVPTGKPTDAEFPTSASIPPVSIMTPEPSAGASAAQHTAPSTATAQTVPTPRPAPARKPAASRPHVAAPVRLTPPPGAPTTQE